MKMRNLVLLLALFMIIAPGCGKKDVRPVPAGVGSAEENTPMDTAMSLFSRAEKEFRQKNFTVAMKLYAECARKFPRSKVAFDSFLKSADLYLMHGQYEKAMTSYDRAISLGGDEGVMEARVGRLACLNRVGRHEEAVNEAGELLSQGGSNGQVSRVYNEASMAYGAIGADLEAAFYLTAAYVNAEGDFKEELYVSLGRAVRAIPPKSVAGFEKMVSGLMLLGQLLQELGIDPADIYELDGKSYVIGCLFPLTGKYGVYGEKAMKSIELAMYMSSDELGENSIRLIFKDTASDPEVAVQAVRELEREGVAAIIGPIGTVTEAASEAQLLGVPLIAVTGRADVGSIGDFVFRNGLTHKVQAKAIVRHAVEKEGLRSFAILYPRKKYGEDFMNLFWDEVESYGLEIKGVESYSTGVTDFAEPIKKLVGLHYEEPDFVKEYIEGLEAAKEQAVAAEDVGLSAGEGSDAEMAPLAELDELSVEAVEEEAPEEPEEPVAKVDFDAVFIPDAPGRVGLILPQLLYYDIENVYLLGTNLWHSKKLLELARREAQGAVMPESFYPESGNENVRLFVRSFDEAFGEMPGYVEAVTFDSAFMVFQAISRETPLTRAGVRDALAAVDDFPGVTGSTSFDENGDARKKLLFLKVSGRKFKEIGER